MVEAEFSLTVSLCFSLPLRKYQPTFGTTWGITSERKTTTGTDSLGLKTRYQNNN